jgi:DNA-binding MarR family transcriptional regulator
MPLDKTYNVLYKSTSKWRTVMVEDVVRALGYLTLGTRFKRIGERLQGDATRIVAAHGETVQSGHATFLAALDRLGPLTIGELAEAVGITQPGATRTVAHLGRLGLVSMRQPQTDQRRRVISLTAKGRKQVDVGKRETWPLVEAAVADLCAGLSGPLLDQLAALEDGLADRPLEKRIPPRSKP